MSVTINYNRDKDPKVNVTPIDLTLLVGEKPDAPTAIGGTGTTGNMDMRLQADADPGAGADIQDLFKVETTINIDSAGVTTLVVTTTPVLGDGSLGTPVVSTVPHTQSMDAWQAAAGQPQLP